MNDTGDIILSHCKISRSNRTIRGDGNIITGTYCRVFGDSNIIRGSNTFVSGDYNDIEAANCTIYGYKNRVTPGLSSRYVSTTKYSEPEAPARESTVNFTPNAWTAPAPAQATPAVVSSSAPPPPPVRSGTDIEDVRDLKYTNEQLPDGAAACVICFEREPDVIAMPCMHKRFCGVCVVRMNDEKTQVNEKTKKMKCSLCQKDVDKFAKVY
jgi:hypothetical protein